MKIIGMSESVMTREDIQRERQRLGILVSILELKCPHEVYEIEKQETVYDCRSEVWYDCFCHDCYKQWTVYEGDKTFHKVKEKHESSYIQCIR